MKYGENGVGLWESRCGALNGGAAAIRLFVSDKQPREQLIAQLFVAWYESTEIPTYRPAEPTEVLDIPASVAESVLCHVSVGKWCQAAGKKVGDPALKPAKSKFGDCGQAIKPTLWAHGKFGRRASSHL